MTLHETLQQYWHYSTFRPMQQEVIQSVLEGHDTLAILPTGGGKSLCFQLPAMQQEGLCLVVSPLVSLMQDQVQRLRRRHIKAYCLSATMSRHERDLAVNQCAYGRAKFLYISPERLCSNTFLATLRTLPVSLVAVDEAHCISQWGYDFRPSYLHIARLRDHLPRVPFVALTATATPRVAQDIQALLRFRDGRLFRTPFLRPNLAYRVHFEEDKHTALLRSLRPAEGSTLIYLRNRRRVQDVAAQLQHAGIPAVPYHAGMDRDTRERHQQQWMQGQVPVLVATNAFGMGIDKADVRCVVHLDIPTTPEEYYQETGRAGRDGKPATALMLYDHADIEQLQRSVQQTYPPLTYIRNVYDALGNYYQVPVGAGEYQRFELNLEHFCRTYRLEVYPTYAALHLLERDGLLSIPMHNEAVSRLRILTDRETLYRYQVAHPRYDALLQALLRSYGGLFTEYTYIYEHPMAKKLAWPETQVKEMLLTLRRDGVVDYLPKSIYPMLTFTAPRVPSQSITLSTAQYSKQKALLQHRADFMQHYVTGKEECRSMQLAAYFGDADTAPCGCCDVCAPDLPAGDKEAPLLLAILREQPCTPRQLLAAHPDIPPAQAEGQLRHLLDTRQIYMNKAGLLCPT